MRKQKRSWRPKGFTIVEILVVVIIIAALATMIVPRFFGRIGKAKQSVAISKLRNIETAIEMFNNDYSRLPENLDELVTRPADILEEKWIPPTLRSKDLLDPWDRQYIYKQPGEHGAFDLYSYGADAQAGGKKENADVVNW